MQANYPKKMSPTYWDPVNVNYPVKKNHETGISSETIGREWRTPPEVLKTLKTAVSEGNLYNRDYNITRDLSSSQSHLDYGYKKPEAFRFNKHISSNENFFIYPPSKKLTDGVPAQNVHGTTEMKESFTQPIRSCRLITDKDQYKNPVSLPIELNEIEPFRKEIEQLDTTYEGFEKYLDPYLTMNRLHHWPFTADVLSRPSNSKNIVTYYTYSNTPWVRSPKPNIEEWRLPLSKAKANSLCDRTMFKEAFREIRTHNKLNWVPGTFRTETRDNYIYQSSRPESRIRDYQEEVRSQYQRCVAKLQTNAQEEQSTIKYVYKTENSHVGSERPICSTLDQHSEKNKKLVKREELLYRNYYQQ